MSQLILLGLVGIDTLDEFVSIKGQRNFEKLSRRKKC